ncbi:2-methylaconitate cis-trans isomerase PrpF [Paracoccus aurantiacus]|uniref:2-methylaconitate cis-trans isomerase PrpF n=1 Tax=Paracoccus aurantiacus TaxID=2599412 RepID=A0A5C6S8Z0_9RHOB|nr:2-methylaconitate cis-trans isomerase PrpF [Paracoccus aurantiacus]TXB70941.1 2-methylaconitate cis-trans isomerase PrpF [Paracoccus aurantiacus]
MQRQVKAVYMRGGTSKGVFFRDDWLPADPSIRDRVLTRVIGTPDPYGQQIDGLGGATSSTSKVVILSPSARTDCDVDYRFGQVAIDRPLIDWSGNCGNLTAAVGPFAIAQGLVTPACDGMVKVRIWQANIQAKIIAHVPVSGGEVVEDGCFMLDGVAFPAAEIAIEFVQPAADDPSAGSAMFPTGHMLDVLDLPGVGQIEATLINAGNPTIFVDAARLGLTGTELQKDVNGDADLLRRVEDIRALGAVRMGLAASADEATANRPHTPKLAFVAAPAEYIASSGARVEKSSVDLNARIFSMGKLHHAMTGTGAVALAAAAAVPGTLVSRVLQQPKQSLRFGHPSGRLEVGATAEIRDGGWVVTTVRMSRSARRLMEGVVLVPEQAFG